jgi:predicted component of type VI protein secretion system
MEAELKGLKKIGTGGELTTRLKYQITSVNGDSEQKTIREFVDNYLLSIDSNALRQYMSSITPDLDLNLNFNLSDGTEVKNLSLPFELDFFFPGSRS